VFLTSAFFSQPTMNGKAMPSSVTRAKKRVIVGVPHVG
jgi:hypothetical protein